MVNLLGNTVLYISVISILCIFYVIINYVVFSDFHFLKNFYPL